jgi:hypothetical protein
VVLKVWHIIIIPIGMLFHEGLREAVVDSIAERLRRIKLKREVKRNAKAARIESASDGGVSEASN